MTRICSGSIPPKATVAFTGLQSPAGDVSQYGSTRGGKGRLCLLWVSTCWRAYSEAHFSSLVHQRVPPSPESAADQYQGIRTLWGTRCLLGGCSTPLYPGHLPEKPPWFVHQPAGVRRTGWESTGDGWDTCGRRNYLSTKVSLQMQAYREHILRQPNSHMYELQT